MARRSYDQYCGLARALDVLGERWTLLIVRNLLLGPQRYSELLRGLPGITTNLLAKRLQEMEAEGLIERGEGTSDAAAYRLTAIGRDLEPAIHALGRWGWRRMGKPTGRDRRSIEWLLVSLRRRYRGDVTLSTELEADANAYHIVLRGARADIGRAACPVRIYAFEARAPRSRSSFSMGCRRTRMHRASRSMATLGSCEPSSARSSAAIHAARRR
jgi:DNA-binding HxlR family transcriptional regulator